MESQSETTQTVSALKLPMLKTGDYDLWSMRMEQYLTHTDYAFWEVIVNGDTPAIASASAGTEGPIPRKSAEQKLARKNELKAKGIMLLAIPDEHLSKVEKILKETGRNLNVNWQRTVGFDKTNVEYYNCHRRGHIARECRAPRNQGNRNGDAPRRNAPVDTSTTNGLVVQDGYVKSQTDSQVLPIIEDWDTDSDNDSVFRPKSDQTKPKLTKINFVKSNENVKFVNKENTHRQVEYPRKSQSPRENRRKWNGMMTQKLGNGQVPVNAVKQSSPRAAASISTDRPVNTTAPKSKVNDALPKTYSYFKAHSPSHRAHRMQLADDSIKKTKEVTANDGESNGPKKKKESFK
ncbi:ribonuclease H-like domain-containing protein [Tanacetum coccineum]